MNTRPVGADFFHKGGQRDGQTNMTKLSAILRKHLKIQKGAEKTFVADFEIFVWEWKEETRKMCVAQGLKPEPTAK
jgi:hypothetical protein